MLYGCSDMGVFAAARPPACDPDQRWVYSSGTSNVLADVLYARIGGTPDALHHLAYDEFFNRLGITTAVFEHDESDAFVGSSYLYMSARDWLRVCRLYMDDGVWNGDRILPEGWVEYSLTPTPNSTNACYGAHIWLNAAQDPGDRQMPSVPADAFMFKGFQSQWIVGIPSKDLMVARLGVTHGEERWSPEDVIVKVMEVLEGKTNEK
jgi:CubicO group peptidase (beta-lactamase class C family)